MVKSLVRRSMFMSIEPPASSPLLELDNIVFTPHLVHQRTKRKWRLVSK